MKVRALGMTLICATAFSVGAGLIMAAANASEPQAKAAAAPAGDAPVFLHTLDDVPLKFEFRPDQTATPAVEQFHKTAQNPYSGDASAISDGEQLYKKLCQACHLKDGKGRIGPNLVDDETRYKRTGTDKGQFEIIYAGGAGAMQAFGKRIDQDEILKVMAYVEALKAKAKN